MRQWAVAREEAEEGLEASCRMEGQPAAGSREPPYTGAALGTEAGRGLGRAPWAWPGELRGCLRARARYRGPGYQVAWVRQEVWTSGACDQPGWSR